MGAGNAKEPHNASRLASLIIYICFLLGFQLLHHLVFRDLNMQKQFCLVDMLLALMKDPNYIFF